MLYPEQQFLDITRSIQDVSRLATALDNDELTVIFLPEVSGSDAPKTEDGNMPLSVLNGPCAVIDVSHTDEPMVSPVVLDEAIRILIDKETQLQQQYGGSENIPRRLIVKTRSEADNGAERYFSDECIAKIKEHGIFLFGTDAIRLKSGQTQDQLFSALREHGIACIFNLELRGIKNGERGFLIVSPLKLSENQRLLPARVVIRKR